MSRQHSSGDLIADRRYAYAEACLAEGDPAAAAEMAEQALERAPAYAPAWALLGRAREALSTPEAALNAYASALANDPEDRLGIGVALARLGAAGEGAALSSAYVRTLFDGYSDRFEAHLVGALGYRGPEMLRAALDGLPEAPVRFASVLDLGCGTGLMGVAIRDRAERIAGVDLSPAMLAKARAKGLYARLVAGDLLDFLNGEPPASADLVLAADVFIYLPDLVPVLAGVARVLAPGGLTAFTIQSHAGAEPVRLGADARYAHSDAHLAASADAAGLAVRLLAPAAIRRERGEGVPGRIAVLAAPDGACTP